MADYKESTISGTQWQRCSGVYIQNTYGQTPQITLREEQISLFNNVPYIKEMGQISFFFDPNAEIGLLDPTTGEPTEETMMFSKLYQALWSLYMQKATERDLAIQNAEPT